MAYQSVQEEANEKLRRQCCQGVAKLEAGGSVFRGRRKKVSVLDRINSASPCKSISWDSA